MWVYTITHIVIGEGAIIELQILFKKVLKRLIVLRLT